MKPQVSQPLSPISTEEMALINKHLIYPMPKPGFTVIPRTPSPPRAEPVPPLITMIVTPPQPPAETQISTAHIFQQIEQRMRDLFGEETSKPPAAGPSFEMPPPPPVERPRNSIVLRRNSKNMWTGVNTPPTIVTPDRAITPEPIVPFKGKPRVSRVKKPAANKAPKARKQPVKKEKVPKQPVKKEKPPKQTVKKEKAPKQPPKKEKTPRERPAKKTKASQGPPAKKIKISPEQPEKKRNVPQLQPASIDLSALCPACLAKMPVVMQPIKKKEKGKSRVSEQTGNRSVVKNPTPRQSKMSVPVSIPLLLLVPPEKRNRRHNRLLMPRPGGGLQWITITQ